jgi:hypothetical protein
MMLCCILKITITEMNPVEVSLYTTNGRRQPYNKDSVIGMLRWSKGALDDDTSIELVILNFFLDTFGYIPIGPGRTERLEKSKTIEYLLQKSSPVTG